LPIKRLRPIKHWVSSRAGGSSSARVGHHGSAELPAQGERCGLAVRFGCHWVPCRCGSPKRFVDKLRERQHASDVIACSSRCFRDAAIGHAIGNREAPEQCPSRRWFATRDRVNSSLRRARHRCESEVDESAYGTQPPIRGRPESRHHATSATAALRPCPDRARARCWPREGAFGFHEARYDENRPGKPELLEDRTARSVEAYPRRTSLRQIGVEVSLLSAGVLLRMAKTLSLPRSRRRAISGERWAPITAVLLRHQRNWFRLWPSAAHGAG